MTILRVRLADGREIDLAVPPGSEQLSPPELLQQFVVDGELALSDTETVPESAVTSLVLVGPEAPEGPGWGPGLQDEDVATALEENYPPPHDREE